MKKIFFAFILIVSALFMTGCANYKQVPYFQNVDSIDLSRSQGLFDARIMPKDELTIIVSSTNPEASTQFNLAAVSNNQLNIAGMSNTQSGLLNYLVENDGTINFPVLGRLKVVGMTKTEVQAMIEEKIAPYFAATEHPVVTVRLANFHVTVLGEFGGAKVINVSSERITVLEALAQAGDLSIYGKRRNVLLIREDATGKKSIHRYNFNDANLINSPYYYLQQNDILYAEPLKVKTLQVDMNGIYSYSFGLFSSVLSLTTLVINVLK